MSEIYIVAAVVIACSAWLYLSLKNKIEQSAKAGSPAPVYVPQPAAIPAPAYSVPVQTTSGNEDEIAAVISAAIMAFESGSAQVAAAPAAIAEAVSYAEAPVTVKKYRRHGGAWVTTERYQTHKRL